LPKRHGKKYQEALKKVEEALSQNGDAGLEPLKAVEVALSQHPAMILMDVAMPGIDGIEAMRRIKAEVPGQPIVIASAHSMASDRERFLAAGADDILSKPFRLADLVAVVAKLTANQRV